MSNVSNVIPELDSEHSIEVQTHTSHLITFSMFLHFVTCDLDLYPFDLKTIPLVGYPKVIPCTKFEDFGVIRF